MLRWDRSRSELPYLLQSFKFHHRYLLTPSFVGLKCFIHFRPIHTATSSNLLSLRPYRIFKKSSTKYRKAYSFHSKINCGQISNQLPSQHVLRNFSYRDYFCHDHESNFQCVALSLYVTPKEPGWNKDHRVSACTDFPK